MGKSWGEIREEALRRCGQLPPKTNADRIRSMTDEELAEWISLATWRAFANGAGNMNYVDAARIEVGEWLDWLKQEASE